MSGAIYLFGALLLGAGFLYQVMSLYRAQWTERAMKVFQFSIYYLMGLFGFLLVDHYVSGA